MERVMEKGFLLYEGKTKQVYETQDPNLLILHYKDDAAAFKDGKRGAFVGKGAINNRMSSGLMLLLEREGIPTHYVKELNERETLVKRVGIIPLEVMIRNLAAGSFSKRYGLPEGLVFESPILEFAYKNKELGDPLLNTSHAVALKLASSGEISVIRDLAFEINQVLRKFWLDRGITLVDLTLEFGRLPDGGVVLADEISPNICRLWDAQTNMKLDKDRSRRDLGDEEEAYQEVMKRLKEYPY